MSRNRVVTGVGVYEADDDWAKIADGWSFREVAGIARVALAGVRVQQERAPLIDACPFRTRPL